MAIYCNTYMTITICETTNLEIDFTNSNRVESYIASLGL